MSKTSFVLYTEYYEYVQALTTEQKGLLFDAIMCYELDRDIPDLDPVTNMAFSFIKGQLIRDDERWAEISEKRAAAGRKGGSKQKANASFAKQTEAKQANADFAKHNVDENVDENVDVDEIKESVERKTARETRHKYGQYNHVRLSDSEIKRLYDDYGEEKTLKAIRKLDEYIQQTGKKYKDHNLALRNWCFKAVDEDEERSRPRAPARDAITEGKTRTGFLNFEPRQYNRDLVRQIEALS